VWEKKQLANENKNSSETPIDPRAKFRTKRYRAIMIVTVVVLASLLVGIQFLPKNSNIGFVPEGGIYAVGETRAYSYQTVYYYNTTNTETTTNRSIEFEVQNFVGSNYRIEQTMNYEGHTLSATLKTNLKGQIFEVEGIPVNLDNSTSLFPLSTTGYVQFLNENVSVGDSWQIIINRQTGTETVEGTITYKLSEITNVTVPAGTYEAIKIEAQIPNYKVSSSSNQANMQVVMNVTGYIILEKDTHIPIKYETVQQVKQTTGSTVTSGTATEQMQLTQHTK
jgi:hypothetical protein